MIVQNAFFASCVQRSGSVTVRTVSVLTVLHFAKYFAALDFLDAATDTPSEICLAA